MKKIFLICQAIIYGSCCVYHPSTIIVKEHNAICSIDTIFNDITLETFNDTILLHIDKKNDIVLLSDSNCFYQYRGYIKKLNAYYLKYLDYNSEYSILVDKRTGKKYQFEGKIAFSDDYNTLVSWIDQGRITDSLTKIQVYCKRGPEYKLLLSYETDLWQSVNIKHIASNKILLEVLYNTDSIKYYTVNF